MRVFEHVVVGKGLMGAPPPAISARAEIPSPSSARTSPETRSGTAASSRATTTRRCILCPTPSGYPILEQVDDALFVAAGGNGGSAKGSDTLGRFAARLVNEPGFDYLGYVRSLF